MEQRLAYYGAGFDLHIQIAQRPAKPGIDEVQRFDIPRNASLNLFLKVILPDTEARNICRVSGEIIELISGTSHSRMSFG
jgi:hypothetical protein